MLPEPEPPAAPRGDLGERDEFEQDQQTGHRNQQHRDDVERRQCGRGKRAQPDRRQIGAEASQGGETRLQACEHASRLHGRQGAGKDTLRGERKWHDHGPDMILRWQPSRPR